VLGKRDHRVVSTDADEVHDLGGSTVDRDLSTFDRVVRSHVPVRDLSGRHHIGDVHLVDLVQAGIPSGTRLVSHEVPLDVWAAGEIHPRLIEKLTKSTVVLNVGRDLGEPSAAEFVLRRLDQIDEIIGLKTHLKRSLTLTD
jgi:hypothetical protein